MDFEQHDDLLIGFDILEAFGLFRQYIQCAFHIGKRPVARQFLRFSADDTNWVKMNGHDLLPYAERFAICSM